MFNVNNIYYHWEIFYLVSLKFAFDFKLWWRWKNWTKEWLEDDDDDDDGEEKSFNWWS